MISVASLMRGVSADFQFDSDSSFEKGFSYDRLPKQYNNGSLGAEYENFSTFPLDKYKRPAMCLPFNDDEIKELFRYEEKDEMKELVDNVRSAQREYLDLLTEMFVKEPSLASEMVIEELSALYSVMGENKKSSDVMKRSKKIV